MELRIIYSIYMKLNNGGNFTMSKRYAIWDKVSDIYTPVGERLTAQQWIDRYGWIKAPGSIPVVAAGLINGALIDELSQMKTRYEQQGCVFTDGMSNQEILDTIEAFEDQRAADAKAAAEEAANTPSAEERLAAAVEFQNLMNME